jgi:hypothetical protein
MRSHNIADKKKAIAPQKENAIALHYSQQAFILSVCLLQIKAPNIEPGRGLFSSYYRNQSLR